MKRLLFSVLLSIAAAAGLHAVTRLPSADGQFWDIQDTSAWSQDSGGIATGGRANPFNGFGYLKIRVRAGRAEETILVSNQYLHGFGLAHDGDERFDAITPVLEGGVVVARGIYAPKDTSYLRYVDRYTNTAPDARVVDVAWGGCVRGVRRRWPGRDCCHVEWRSPHRPHRQLRDRHAERA
jgi:hypothetical protein